MPREIRSKEEFVKLLAKSSECRVVRRGENVKLKLRTPNLLYVYVTGPEEAAAILKEVKAPIAEL